MISWCYLFGGMLYIIVGQACNKITANYLWELYDKVMDVHDERYAKMILYNVPVMDTKFNRILVDVIFVTFWPAICIAVILKAEVAYDRIMRRNVFRRNAP